MKDLNPDFDHEAEAARMFCLIGNPVAEIRAIPRRNDTMRDTMVGLFRNDQDFGDAAVGLSALTAHNQLFAGVYMTMNRLFAEPFMSLATGTTGKGYGVRDHHIDRIVTLFIDIDASRNDPLGGKVCSTDTEHAAALALAQQIADFACALGWPQPLVMDSGSGAYVIFRIDLANNRESVALIKSVLEAFAAKFDTPAAHIDKGVFNPSRVVRIAGTWNRKSQHTDERPNRAVRILSTPTRLQAVTVEQLNAFAESNIVPSEINEISEKVSYSPDEYDAGHNIRLKAVLRYLERVGIAPGSPDCNDDRFIRIPLPYCPFKGPEHTDGRTAILIWHGGAIGAKCFHEKCVEKGWWDMQIALSQNRYHLSKKTRQKI